MSKTAFSRFCVNCGKANHGFFIKDRQSLIKCDFKELYPSRAFPPKNRALISAGEVKSLVPEIVECICLVLDEITSKETPAILHRVVSAITKVSGRLTLRER
ncbi:hypothetical protein NPIL_322931 [Nephila pilipes]|uniref:Uncharacterized protein n=1 Tax=Nephila pilipes TaxID=299642 RepID=A0A8X6R5W7_NEPPI|nr:hypothetical protein NPIL_322931 [Nephila pilipes]